MALYCHDDREEYSLAKYFRMMRAHSAAAVGEDSAASTIGGRKSTSSFCATEASKLRLVDIARKDLKELVRVTYFCGSAGFAKCFLARFS